MADFGSAKLTELENRTFLGSSVLQSGFCGEKQQENRSNNSKFLVTIKSQYSRQKLMSQTSILPLKPTLYSVVKPNREFDLPSGKSHSPRGIYKDLVTSKWPKS